MKNKNLNFDIDLVYLWVDGADPEWQQKKNLMLVKDNRPAQELKGRYENNDELKYSLRSVEKYAPWIRHIYIVTDNQIPDWLDLNNSKISIIDHRDILPQESLPCFNSAVIEYFIYKIPGLSEHFIYANDDMFIQKNINRDFFFNDSNGLPIVRLQRSLSNKYIRAISKKLNINSNTYRKKIDNSASLIEKEYGIYYSDTPHHNIDAYLKSDYQNLVENVFKEEIEAVITNHFRKDEDIQRIIFLYYTLAIKHGKKIYVNRSQSARIRVQEPDFMSYINKYDPYLFCLNDTEKASDEDRARIKPFLKTLYPNKSSFEK